MCFPPPLSLSLTLFLCDLPPPHIPAVSVSATATQADLAPDRGAAPQGRGEGKGRVPVKVEFTENSLTYMDRLLLKKHRRYTDRHNSMHAPHTYSYACTEASVMGFRPEPALLPSSLCLTPDIFLFKIILSFRKQVTCIYTFIQVVFSMQ